MLPLLCLHKICVFGHVGSGVMPPQLYHTQYFCYNKITNGLIAIADVAHK